MKSCEIFQAVFPIQMTIGSERVKGLTECIDGEVFHCFVKARSASGFTIQKTTSFSFHLFSHLELMGMTEFEGRAIQFLVD